jgi:hypothetical protein
VEAPKATQATQGSADTPAQPSESAAEPAPQPDPEPAVIKLTGKGTRVSKKFTLTEGLAVFSMTHRGHSNFIVDLRSTDGSVDENLVNEIGNFKGSWPLFLDSAATYLLKVDADGPWTFTITQPRPTNVPTVTSFSGKGKTATQLFYLESGMKTVTLKHSGKSNFIVDVYGAANENLVNEIGNFDGSTVLDVSDSGGAIFSVEADGKWSISIE